MDRAQPELLGCGKNPWSQPKSACWLRILLLRSQGPFCQPSVSYAASATLLLIAYLQWVYTRLPYWAHNGFVKIFKNGSLTTAWMMSRLVPPLSTHLLTQHPGLLWSIVVPAPALAAWQQLTCGIACSKHLTVLLFGQPKPAANAINPPLHTDLQRDIKSSTGTALLSCATFLVN